MDKKFFLSYILFLTSLSLVFAGGMVTSTGTGLAIPDWPLAYGRLFPPLVGGIWYIQTHRFLASIVALLTLAQVLWVWKSQASVAAKKVAWACLAGLVIQISLGGVGVLILMPPWIAIAHACFGPVFLSLIGTLCYFLNNRRQSEKPIASAHARSFTRLACTTALFCFFQLLLGAFIRRRYDIALEAHIWSAFFILIHAFFLFLKMRQDSGISRSHGTLLLLSLVLIAIQMLTGLSVFYLKHVLSPGVMPSSAELYSATVHQTLGAAILVLFVLITIHAMRTLTETGMTQRSSVDYLRLMHFPYGVCFAGISFIGYIARRLGDGSAVQTAHCASALLLFWLGSTVIVHCRQWKAGLARQRAMESPLSEGHLTSFQSYLLAVLMHASALAEMYFFVASAAGRGIVLASAAIWLGLRVRILIHERIWKWFFVVTSVVLGLGLYGIERHLFR